MPVRSIIRLWKHLKEDKEYREGYVDAHCSVKIPFQVYSLRKQRNWTQADLAKRSGLSRSSISAIEQAGGGPRTLEALQKLCAAFDVGLQIQFISFSGMVESDKEFDPNTFSVTSFSSDTCPAPENIFTRRTSRAYKHIKSTPSKKETHQEVIVRYITATFEHPETSLQDLTPVHPGDYAEVPNGIIQKDFLRNYRGEKPYCRILRHVGSEPWRKATEMPRMKQLLPLMLTTFKVCPNG